MTHCPDAHRCLSGDDAAVAVRHDHDRLVPLGQDSAHRGDVLGQPGAVRPGRPVALAAARQRRGNAADAALLQGRGGQVPPPRSVTNARPVHKDNTHLFLLDSGIPGCMVFLRLAWRVQSRAPPRSARFTRIAMIVMTRASSMIPAVTTKARENPVARAWW